MIVYSIKKITTVQIMRITHFVSLSFLLVWVNVSKVWAQVSTASVTINYPGFTNECCPANTTPYLCYNDPSCSCPYCGTLASCNTQTFIDPVPAGDVVISIDVDYYTAGGVGGSCNGTLNSIVFPNANQVNSGFGCTNVSWTVNTSSSLCSTTGISGYNYGGSNTFKLCFTGTVCINKAVIVLSYVSPSILISPINASGPTTFCQGGSVVLNAGSGYAGYNWNTGASTQSITASTSGTYGVTLTIMTGCTISASTTVTVNPNPSVTASSTKTGCTVANGTATANPSGGTNPYTYNWTPSAQSTLIATGLATGTYTILLTDVNGCTKTNTVSVTATSPPTVTASSTQAGCTVANGTATANPLGGTGAYTYLWTPSAQSTQTATGLAAGTTYIVTVTDANGCSAATTVSVSTTSNIPSTTAVATNSVSCFCGNNGSATATPTGGTGAYAYLWNPSAQSTQTATGLVAGTYAILLTDANG